MADANERFLAELIKKPGNNVCADCGAKKPEWASYNIGIFVCTRCAGVHRSMGAHISKVKHLKLDKWEDSQVSRIRQVGNILARTQYELCVPPCYRRPTPDTPQVLVEQWIRAKYEREEFSHTERQNHYISGYMEGFLMKRGKEDARYHPRKFVLNETDDTLKYYVKENKDPKAVLRLSELNVAFAPAKTGKQNSLQISLMNKEGTTRHIYVYHEEAEVVTNWYLAIRCAKLHWLQVAYPGASEAELQAELTRDFSKEGYLWKTGPRVTDCYRKRWFTLDGRKLMYHEEPMDAYPKGEIFIGHAAQGYGVRLGLPPGAKNHHQGFPFTLETPDRAYLLSAPTDDDRHQWIALINNILDKTLTPHETNVAARIARKRTSSGSISIFSSSR